MAPLTRVLAVIVITGVCLFAAGSLLWYLAYGVEKDPPAQQRVQTLTAPAHITWGSRGEVSLQAQNEHDALTALGYVHGLRRAWSIVLWRQAATGRLGEWFGEPALPLDRLARRLGLSHYAQVSFARLPAEEQALLRSYAEGVNAALRRPEVRLQPEFVLLDLDAEPWQPWHTLALERLFAWLAVPPPAPEQLADADAGTRAFYEADRSLRRWLQIHGFENSIAWAARDSAGTAFFQRQVYGATALPFLLETALRYPDSGTVWGASLPGTPFFPAGKSDGKSWALLLKGTATLERVPWDSSAARLEHERILNKDGIEHLAAFWRMGDRLPLENPETSFPDSVWTLRWAGLEPGTDVAAWRGLLRGEDLPFTLLRGDGLWMSQSGTWHVLGNPEVAMTLPTGIFVGDTFWSGYAAELLRSQESGPLHLQTWIDDAYSIWAAQNAPPLLDALGALPTDTSAVQEALTYLRNWDFSYDRASIAASIFDTWVSLYRHATGRLPAAAVQDSAGNNRSIFFESLIRAVDTLSTTYGDDMSQWRWERVQPDRRLFPIWSVEDLRPLRDDLKNAARYRPIELPGRGHPSALAWGTSPVLYALPAPATWEAWVRTDSWEAFTVRRRLIDPNALLGRYLLSDRPPGPIRFPGSDAAVTLLSPGPPAL